MPVVWGDRNGFDLGSYTVEVFWWDCTVRTVAGVYVLMSTPTSVRSKMYLDFDVFFIPGAAATWIVGEVYGEALSQTPPGTQSRLT